MEEQKREIYITDDKSMKNVLTFFTVVFILMGMLIIWKGVTAAIPQAGWAYGLWFLIAGVFFIAVGIGMTIFLRKQAQKRAARDAKMQEEA